MTPFQRRQLDLMRQMEMLLAKGAPASTIVPMQTDYHNDPQIALTIISRVPKDIARSIQMQLIEPLRAIEPEFFYYPNDALHVTIQNVRVIHNPPRFTASDVSKVKILLEELIPKTKPFPFTYAGLLSMPTSVSIIALVSPEYDQFIRHLRKSLTDAGVPDDKTYFTDEVVFANTTICRYTHAPSKKFTGMLAKCNDLHVGQFTPEKISLVSMNAVASPTKTTVLGEYQFAGI